MRRLRISRLAAIFALLLGPTASVAVAGTVTGTPLGPPFGTAPQLALTDGTVSNDGTNLAVTLNFSTTIAPPSAGAANSVFGYIFLDTDQEKMTGVTVPSLDPALGLGLSVIPPAQIPRDLGVDEVVDLDSVGGTISGDVDVLSATTLNVLTSVPIKYTLNSLSFSIPVSALIPQAPVDSSVFFGAIVGNPVGPTDSLLGLPEPSTIELAVLAAVCLGSYRAARRRGRRRAG